MGKYGPRGSESEKKRGNERYGHAKRRDKIREWSELPKDRPSIDNSQVPDSAHMNNTPVTSLADQCPDYIHRHPRGRDHVLPAALLQSAGVSFLAVASLRRVGAPPWHACILLPC